MAVGESYIFLWKIISSQLEFIVLISLDSGHTIICKFGFFLQKCFCYLGELLLYVEFLNKKFIILRTRHIICRNIKCRLFGVLRLEFHPLICDVSDVMARYLNRKTSWLEMSDSVTFSLCSTQTPNNCKIDDGRRAENSELVAI